MLGGGGGGVGIDLPSIRCQSDSNETEEFRDNPSDT